jgi:hypothetical protein
MTAADLLAQLPQMENEARDHELKAQALRQIIAAVRALNGHAAEVKDPRLLQQNGTVFIAQPLAEGGPRGTDAVRRVMRESAAPEWKVIDLKRELLRRGWAPTPKAVEATISRMRETGELESVRYGYYKLASLQRDEQAAPLTNLQGEEDDAT